MKADAIKGRSGGGMVRHTGETVRDTRMHSGEEIVLLEHTQHMVVGPKTLCLQAAS